VVVGVLALRSGHEGRSAPSAPSALSPDARERSGTGASRDAERPPGRDARPVALDVTAVSEPGGVPLAGARVVLTAATGDRRSVVAEVTTDASGRAELRCGPVVAPLVSAYASGHVGTTLEPAASASSVRLTLRRLAAIEGRVRDSEGRPVEATVTLALGVARVDAVHMLPEEVPAASDIAARSDGEGRFAFAGLPPGDGYRVRAVAGAMHSEVERKLTLQPGETARLELVLEVGGGVAGRFVSAAGAPLAGGEVRLYRPEGAGWRQAHGNRTDADGRFLVPGVRAGNYLLQAEHVGDGAVSFAGRHVTVERGAVVDVGEVRPDAGLLEVATVLAPGAPAPENPEVKLALLVAVRAREAPLPFASVALRSRIGASLLVHGLPAGELHVTVSPEDRALQRVDHRESWHPDAGRRRIEIPLSAEPPQAVLRVELGAFHEVLALALIADGALVRRTAMMGEKPGLEIMARLPADRAFELWVLGRRSFARADVAPIAGGAVGTVRPTPGEKPCVLAGTVRSPRPGLRVVLALPAGDWPIEHRLLEVPVGPRGEFRIEGVPPRRTLQLAVAEGLQCGTPLVVHTPESGGSDETLALDPP